MTLSAHQCTQVLAVCLPRLAIRGAASIQDGWCSLVLDVNGGFIFRFARRPKFSWKDCRRGAKQGRCLAHREGALLP
jgi:hypothetical protein